MKRFLVVSALILSASLAVPGIVSAAELKIGFVNPATLLEKAPQAKAASNLLEQEFAPRQKKLESEQARIQKQEAKLERDGAVMSQPEQQKLQREILNDRRELKRKQDEFREDLNIRRNDELGKLEQVIRQAILTLAKEQHYDLIVSDGVLYASPRVDMTDQVLKLLREKAKQPAAAK
ncbi:MAG: hypothetical protein B7Z66_06040 [Chromatiales bacterium 21-64-14]|nr:MAG: hypothetical protein B7Z66_06040 [Chromatiales bacterium 21-64-14]HQU15135.1 OmpH family outer membrane protein [Gammaproteobacteria bacterium]